MPVHNDQRKESFTQQQVQYTKYGPTAGCRSSQPPFITSSKADVIIMSETKNCTHSPNLRGRAEHRIRWKSKKFTLKIPHMPVKPKLLPVPAVPHLRLRPLGFSTWSEKARINYEVQSAKIYARERRYFERVASKNGLENSRRLMVFEKAYSRYEQRLARYHRALIAANNGSYVHRKVVSAGKRPNNGLTETKWYYSPLNGYAAHLEFYKPDCTGTLQAEPSPLRHGSVYNGYLDPLYPAGACFDPPVSDLLNRAVRAAESQAIGQLYERLADQQVHIGNMLAERHQTISMLSDAIRRLSRVSVKGAFKTLFQDRSVSKSVANDYLQFMFGVKPLLADVHGAAQKLAQLNSSYKPDTIVVRASAQNTIGDTRKNTVSFFPKIQDVTLLHTTVKVSYVLEYKITSGSAHELQGLGLLNPAEILWEKLPWSFVLDWILPIGNWIAALNASAGLSFVTGTKTTTITTDYVRSVTSTQTQVSEGYAGQMRAVNANSTARRVNKTRLVLSSPPSVRLPEFRNPLSVTHVAETFALLVQKFS